MVSLLKFWGETRWGNYGKLANSKRGVRVGVYQIDEITYEKGGGEGKLL